MLLGQQIWQMGGYYIGVHVKELRENGLVYTTVRFASLTDLRTSQIIFEGGRLDAVSYTHLRAHET